MGKAGPIEHYVIVRSIADGPVVRMQSEPILRGLRATPGVSAHLHAPGAPEPATTPDSCLVFHYSDKPAIEVVRRMKQGCGSLLVVCLGCDIYSYADYVRLHDFVDLFLAPTELHRKVLASQLYKPVYTLIECVDPVATGDSGEEPDGFPDKTGKRVLWFGYAESFNKGMASLMPVIDANLASGAIESFEVLVDEKKFYRDFGNGFGVSTSQYEEKTFRADVARFDYAILSHFPLDLAVNSYIKSPNKAITALLAGLIPICSDTPNYGALFQRHGLQRFLFASPAELDAALRRLDPVADSRAIQASGVVASLREDGAPARVVKDFLGIVAHHQATRDTLVYTTLTPRPSEDLPQMGLRQHLSDLLPSARRWLRARSR
jgi:hypothetical protein